jgi:hypothetical protein
MLCCLVASKRRQSGRRGKGGDTTCFRLAFARLAAQGKQCTRLLRLINLVKLPAIVRPTTLLDFEMDGRSFYARMQHMQP